MFKDSFVSAFKKTGLHRIRYLVKNKYQQEIDYQKQFYDHFKACPENTLAYWRECLCLNEIVELCNLTESTKILSVGCSPSTVLQFVKGKRFGVDPLADEYKKFHDYKDINVKRSFGEFLPFSEKFFDVVFCTNTLDHVSNPVKVVSEIKRVLSAGGFVLVVVEFFETQNQRDPGHPQCFLVSDIVNLFDGFEVLFKRVCVWNPHHYYAVSKDCVKQDLVMVVQKTL